MRKRSIKKAPVSSGLAILAGSLTFMGTAQAVSLVSEDFEGAVNVFGAGTYNYSQNYTFPNAFNPGGGVKYMKGGAGITGQVSTNTFSLAPLSLLTGGITAGQLDGGQVSYSLYSQFSSYRAQGDYAMLSVQFLDGSSSPIGAALTLGGAAFTSALGSGNNGSYTDARYWGEDSLAGLVPNGARFADVKIFEVKTAGGTAIDGYVDNVTISVSVVPEPASIGLVAFGSGLLALARRRR